MKSGKENIEAMGTDPTRDQRVDLGDSRGVFDELREILKRSHKREIDNIPYGYELAISDIKAAGIKITRGLAFDLIVHLEKRKDERFGK